MIKGWQPTKNKKKGNWKIRMFPYLYDNQPLGNLNDKKTGLKNWTPTKYVWGVQKKT